MDNKELAKLIKTLRKSGVKHYKTAEIELELGDLPTPVFRASRGTTTPSDPIVEDQYSQDDMLFWSSTPPGAI